MNDHGKSDGPIVPRTPANKDGAGRLDRGHPADPSAERAEGRGPAKGNSHRGPGVRAQDRTTPQAALERIRQAVRRDRTQRLTALWHHVYDIDRLREAYFALRPHAAPGVDGQTWRAYGQALEANLRDLSDRLKRGAYRARPVKRVWIPKGDGRQRPIGIPTLEDKLVQRSAASVLGAVYEEEFLDFSYGFRPGRGPHDALDALSVGLTRSKVNWVLDADIRGFLETASYCTPVHEGASNRPGWLSITLIRSPLRLPQRTWTAFNSLRFTRCNTVCRETPSRCVASSIGM